MIYRFFEKCEEDKHNWNKCIFEIEKDIQVPEKAKSLLKEFGINNPAVFDILSTLNEAGELDTEELAILDDKPNSLVHQTMRWAELINITLPVGYRRYKLDDFVSKLFKYAHLKI